MKQVRTRYHSRDWDHLVAQGWITLYVVDNPSDGCRIAIMGKDGDA
jgi:hypothetical protein